MGYLRRGLDAVYLTSGVLAALCLISILGLIVVQMLARWTGEVFPGAPDYAGYAMAAASFLGFANALNRGSHIRVSILLNAVPGGLRRWMEGPEAAESGWLGAVRDPALSRALRAVHGAPGEDWTLPRLAAAAGMSRSAFAARFGAVVGMGPAAYVTRWRMHLARGRLRQGRAPVGAIAEDLGYRSEAAFNRAFKRVFGQTPGQARAGVPRVGQDTG